MKLELTEVLLLDEHEELSLAELSELSCLSEAELLELVDWGIIAPTNEHAARPTFGAQCIVAARTACRIRDDFELEAHAVALALSLLDRIRDLETQMREILAQAPHRVR